MRETGVAFKVLDGEDALPYIGYARTELGILKNAMKLGGLTQGVRSRALPDGTVLRVSSVFGVDKIEIATAPAEQLQEQIELPVLALPEVPEPVDVEDRLDIPPFDLTTVLVNCFTDRSQGVYCYVWYSANKQVEVSVPGAISVIGFDISADGRVVVGRYEDANHFQHPFRWTAQEGATDLGALDPQFASYFMATSTNKNGSVIVGTAPVAAGSVDWYWTKATGMQQLPQAYWQSNLSSMRDPCVSPNGQWIAGTVQQLVTTYTYTSHGPGPITIDPTVSIVPRGALWAFDPAAGVGAPTLLPATGDVDTVNMSYFGTLQFTYTIPKYFIPTGVADDGAVVGPYWTKGGAVVKLDFTSTPGAGLSGITADGRRAVGWYRDDVGTETGLVYTPNTQRMVVFPTGDAIFDVADNGVKYCGGRGPISYAYDFELRPTTPMLWTATGEVELPILGGHTHGWAPALASPHLDLSTPAG